ncbi:unnamed protein product [Adineta ricciae]|uniref:Uncharacterized protein n=1 Tax=Adineta ricciae TaxID=249248 RepID=A0A814W6K9_ADIRI|nr:unnamed protein product [Adineta ricciae]CAF1358749.1 unnamed protein product [Adineta ricciae]
MQLNLIVASIQINLHRTNEILDELLVQHSCLYIPASADYEIFPFQIIPYCLSRWSTTWLNIEADHYDKRLTFIELYALNITGEQLLTWSAPIDIIEDYEFYRNEISSSDDTQSEFSSKVFHNCTPSRFGPLCQYALDMNNSPFLSLEELVNSFYQQTYQPTTLTCYIHLTCQRGSTMMCLDWTEICDGEINCLNNGVDEENCWQIQINECKDDEYRCFNGQCISKIFAHDNSHVYECLDLSDELVSPMLMFPHFAVVPTFFITDIQCSARLAGMNTRLTSSCVPRRHTLLKEAMLFDTPVTLSKPCWLAFQCTMKILEKSNPICLKLCPNTICTQTINETCPDLLFVPYEGFVFGHLQLAYLKNAILNVSMPSLPQYICYNDQLCHGFRSNVTVLKFDSKTCRRFEDFPLQKPSILSYFNWIDMILQIIYQQLYHCNTILYNSSLVCDSSTMYRCRNSSKCISQFQLCDYTYDCAYKDDEQCSLTNEICSTYGSISLFKCPTTNKCVSLKKVKDRFCDCGRDQYGLCDDENSVYHMIRKQISFPTVCDGYTELAPVLIDGRNETDETECAHWQCDNTYTRCDGIWNCFNGADEVDCHFLSTFRECPPKHHVCISLTTYEYICLPLKKAHDRQVDCVAGIDEPQLCRDTNYQLANEQFYCQNHSDESCTSLGQLCHEKKECFFGSHEFLCPNIEGDDGKLPNVTSLSNFLHERLNDERKRSIVYFSLANSHQSTRQITPDRKIPDISSLFPVTGEEYDQRCHRGLPLQVWLNKNSAEKACLCPPSFYGDMCQYQNQRVSLTLKFQTYSAWRQTLFAMIISLIDDSDERVIHSVEHLTYLYTEHCEKKFNLYLLYSTRPKLSSRIYSIHIDIYEKLSLAYHGSHLIPLQYPFLPVHRIALQIQILHPTALHRCSITRCTHGRCVVYANRGDQDLTFCQCYQGWTGKYCTIQHSCKCSFDSLCIGVTGTNRSICVCPRNKWGPRCLLHSTHCQRNPCRNHGQCISMNDEIMSDKEFICICPKGFSGKQCEVVDNKLIFSFEENVYFPQRILIYFIEIQSGGPPINGSIFRTIGPYEKTIIIYWTHPYHIVLVEYFDKNLYLLSVAHTWNQSSTLIRTFNFSNRCYHLSEVFNDTLMQLHLLRRIKYYHLPCQLTPLKIPCFYDDTHFCLCYNHGHDHRVANCFEFSYTTKHDCYDQSSCENQAQCIQDQPICPKTSKCVCPKCFYGQRCQFSFNLFDLSLESILSYHIQPHVSIRYQPSLIQFNIALTMIISITGFINGILSLITFQSKGTRKVGSGIYLFASTITTMVAILIFALKFFIFLFVQISSITNRSFLTFQCRSMDFFLRITLNMTQWLYACVAIERVMTIIKGTNFYTQRSKQMSKYVIGFLMIFMIITTIHDPIHRRLFYDVHDDDDQKRIWCIVTYSSALQLLNLLINIFHFVVPFGINFISAIIIMTRTGCKQRTRHAIDRRFIYKQFQQHFHLFFAPIVLALLAFPRLSILFKSICLTFNTDPWLITCGYYISFIPLTLSFILFIIPSKLYRTQFLIAVNHYRRRLQIRIHPI